MKKYFKVWKQLSNCAISSYLANRIDAGSYFVGKLIRFGFFLLMIISIFHYTNQLGGYSKYEVILFFLTFNLIDVLAQAFFRGIYLFQHDIKTGNFDYVISKPINPLFYSLTRLTDILDIIFLLPIVGLIIYVGSKLPIQLSWSGIILYLVFVCLGMLIVIGIHIISASISIWTIESENVIWFYRDSMTIGRFPPEVLSPFLRFVFTFIMPIIIIVAFPTKALLGILTFRWMVIALIYALIFFGGALLFWRYSLKHYSSASS